MPELEPEQLLVEPAIEIQSVRRLLEELELEALEVDVVVVF